MLLIAATALLYGIRHGIDWDHLAAITDLTSGQDERRKGLKVATAYAGGHGVVVLALGLVAVLANGFVPESIDDVMGRIVGVTLLVLAVSVVVGLVRHRGDFRLRSRWMLIGAGAAKARRWARDRMVEIRHDHPHNHDGHGHGHVHGEHAHAGEADGPHPDGAARTAVVTAHSHQHTHVAVAPHDPFATPGAVAATFVGMLHGIGAETPTQVLVLLTAVHAAGRGSAVAVLLCFIAGILIANTAIALVSTTGYLSASHNFRIYATVAVVNAVASAVIGLYFVFGNELPAIFGG